MAEQENTPNDNGTQEGWIDGLIQKFGLPKWVKSAVLALGIGTGSVGGGSGAVYMMEDFLAESIAPSMAKTLQEDYGFVPVPDEAIPLLYSADSIFRAIELKNYKMEKDMDTIRNMFVYQAGANHVLIQMTCDTTMIDGNMFYKDCYGNLWTEQVMNGIPFIYMATKQYNKWVYFPFQWQIPEGEPNVREVQ